jgi:hypothetical protein
VNVQKYINIAMVRIFKMLISLSACYLDCLKWAYKIDSLILKQITRNYSCVHFNMIITVPCFSNQGFTPVVRLINVTVPQVQLSVFDFNRWFFP